MKKQMKKLAILCIVVFVTAFIVSACNNATCPAYSNVENGQVDIPS